MWIEFVMMGDRENSTSGIITGNSAELCWFRPNLMRERFELRAGGAINIGFSLKTPLRI
ncbi:hypothetical protein GA0061094_3702 [[Bacillus] enclensis]|uniref:Uncharacterized protein n=1 Tax=[Bacillus] enclensis TaxID=1402860 RepID=A0A1C4DAZ2_9BACI|nr:hypothetical protein GA0061094_3702 [[Bacillus] enclensis]